MTDGPGVAPGDGPADVASNVPSVAVGRLEATIRAEVPAGGWLVVAIKPVPSTTTARTSAAAGTIEATRWLVPR